MNEENRRLKEKAWKKWGPYLADRQWGTVREDYSAKGDAWAYTTHDMARSKAFRWGEEGIGGISDDQQLLCFSVALWNKKDSQLKERYFGLSGPEGNHGEDVKECYYYLDNTPTHSYMKLLYKYPQTEFPYQWLVKENRERSRTQPEFDLVDTGIFAEDRYFDVFIEYAKAAPDDILIRITVHNRGPETAALQVLPTIWFRNTWAWGYDPYQPNLSAGKQGEIIVEHRDFKPFFLYAEGNPPFLFCDNESNRMRLHNITQKEPYFKDGINEYIVEQNQRAINPDQRGTKAAANYEVEVPAQESISFQLRLTTAKLEQPFAKFDTLFSTRKKEADKFYADLQKGIADEDKRLVQRQAFAGMLWTKQFYYFDVEQWLKGDPAFPPPPQERLKGRNSSWKHLNNADIISMPDKWEYPWYAAWDLAFHTPVLVRLDPEFAKQQIILLTREWYMHPSGALPAYEWSFSDVNPPIHAWAAWRVYRAEQRHFKVPGDRKFLEAVFHKLLLNFTWWVNRKDSKDNNLFEGGFLGLDNIGVFDRNTKLPSDVSLEQSDATSWVAMYSLNMMRIALELAKENEVYQDLATKFFEHFLYIANAMASHGEGEEGLWDEEDEFYYDELRQADENHRYKLKVRSLVGLIPLFAVEVLTDEIFQKQKAFTERLNWFLNNRPDLATLVSRWHQKSTGELHLLSLLRGHRLKRILARMLDETEFLSDYGIRALSKYHESHPYEMNFNGSQLNIRYVPAESDSGLFGGNSNWRGPIWMPVNYLIILSLRRFYHYYGDDFKVEHPVGSGQMLTLYEVAIELAKRLTRLFLRDKKGRRAIFGDNEKFQSDPHFKDYVLFYEYFHGDNGRGVGAAHQTGWTGLVALLLFNLEDEGWKVYH
ncbi:MAG: glucosidase [Saprospiraceae bacterium]|nr:MAG: glucosidase [Saprospiraceae bacterium]